MNKNNGKYENIDKFVIPDRLPHPFKKSFRCFHIIKWRYLRIKLKMALSRKSPRRKIKFQKLPLILSKRGYTLILTLFTTIIEFSTIVTVSIYNLHFKYYKFRDNFLLYLCRKKYTYRSILLKVSFFLNKKYETLLYYMVKTGKTWDSNAEVVKVLIFNSKFYNALW